MTFKSLYRVSPNNKCLELHMIMYDNRANVEKLFEMLKENAHMMKYINHLQSWWFLKFLEIEQLCQIINLIGHIKTNVKLEISRFLIGHDLKYIWDTCQEKLALK